MRSPFCVCLCLVFGFSPSTFCVLCSFFDVFLFLFLFFLRFVFSVPFSFLYLSRATPSILASAPVLRSIAFSYYGLFSTLCSTSCYVVCVFLCMLRVLCCEKKKKKTFRFFPSLNIRSIQTYTKPAHSTTTEGTVIFPTKNVLPNLMFYFSRFINTGV